MYLLYITRAGVMFLSEPIIGIPYGNQIRISMIASTPCLSSNMCHFPQVTIDEQFFFDYRHEASFAAYTDNQSW